MDASPPLETMCLGIRIACRGEVKKGAKWYKEEKVVAPNGQPCPLSVSMGTPFVVMKTEPVVPLESSLDAVNQHATWLNMFTVPAQLHQKYPTDTIEHRSPPRRSHFSTGALDGAADPNRTESETPR